MFSNRDWFSTYKTLSSNDVLMGNSSSYKITGIGTFKIKIFDGIVQILIDIINVHNLKKNLISLSTLDLNGYKFNGECGVIKASQVQCSAGVYRYR